MATNRDLLSQRLSDRPTFQINNNMTWLNSNLQGSFVSKKKIYNNQPIKHIFPNKLDNFNQAIMGKDLRKPEMTPSKNRQFSGATRNKRNSDLLNQRAERFTPISQHKPFPFLTGQINYNNKPQATRDSNLSHTTRKN